MLNFVESIIQASFLQPSRNLPILVPKNVVQQKHPEENDETNFNENSEYLSGLCFSIG